MTAVFIEVNNGDIMEHPIVIDVKLDPFNSRAVSFVQEVSFHQAASSIQAVSSIQEVSSQYSGGSRF